VIPSSNETVPVAVAVPPVIAPLKVSADPTSALPAEVVRAMVGLVRLLTESSKDMVLALAFDTTISGKPSPLKSAAPTLYESAASW
jgi:hypothetical protein